jgi:hypothetical protein
MYRQGDILIRKIDKLPDDLSDAKTEENRIVLAYGEATGHAHAIHSKNVLFLTDKKTGKFFLIVKKESTLVHEEHSKIILPIGNYEVIRQRFYTPGRIQYVAD